MCSDLFNELADVSVGDAWLPEFKHENPGESVIVSRTKIGEEILASMERGSKLSLIKVHSSKVKQSQAFSLNFKEQNLSRRLMLLTMFGKRTPKINSVQSSSFFWGFLGAFLAYLSFLFSSKRSFRKFLFYVPLPVFRLYFGLFKCVYLLSRCGRF
jgi:Na+/H+ antiporter NhaD/arsenite permease-like protein